MWELTKSQHFFSFHILFIFTSTAEINACGEIQRTNRQPSEWLVKSQDTVQDTHEGESEREGQKQ